MARPRSVSDEDILSAARHVFLEHGGSASTAVIAERIGVSQAALFKRFGTKKELMLAALAPPEVPSFVDRLERGPETGRPVPEQLVEIAMEVLAFLREEVPAMMVLSTCGLDPKALIDNYPVPPPLVAQRAMGSWMTRAIDLGLIRNADTTPLSLTLLGSLHIRVFLSTLTRQPLTDEEAHGHAASVVDALWRGLSPVASEAT